VPIATKLAALAACAVLAILVYELVRKKKIREEYSLTWLALTAVSAVAILFDRLTLSVIRLLGGVNPSSLFFFAGILFCVLTLLKLTVHLSDLKRTQNVLIQENGLLCSRVNQLEKQAGGDRKEAGAGRGAER